MAGNAIDFYIKVLGLSFNQAMKELVPSAVEALTEG